VKNGECEASTKRGYVMVNEWLDLLGAMKCSWKTGVFLMLLAGNHGIFVIYINPENHQFL
jgi:hypothetical protein